MVSEGFSGWSRRDTRGASSSGEMDKSEAWGGTKEYEREKAKEKRQIKRKNEKEKEKSLINITQEDLWALQKMLSGKKGTLGVM